MLALLLSLAAAASPGALRVGEARVLEPPAPIVRVALNARAFEPRPLADGRVAVVGLQAGEGVLVAWLADGSLYSLPLQVSAERAPAPPALPLLQDEPLALAVGHERQLTLAQAQDGALQLSASGVVIAGLRGRALTLRGQAPGQTRLEVETPRGPRFYRVTVRP